LQVLVAFAHETTLDNGDFFPDFCRAFLDGERNGSCGMSSWRATKPRRPIIRSQYPHQQFSYLSERDMNLKRFICAVLAIFGFALLWNGVVHLVLLREANTALEGTARPAAARNLLLSLLPTAGIAVLFVFSHARCVRTGGIRRSIAHGAFFGALAGLFVDLNQYLLYPIPGSLAVAWFLFGFTEFCIYGAIAALVYPVPAPLSASQDGSAHVVEESLHGGK
jgi:hypothetical protein